MPGEVAMAAAMPSPFDGSSTSLPPWDFQHLQVVWGLSVALTFSRIIYRDQPDSVIKNLA